MLKTFPLEIIEKHLNDLKPIPYNKFYWWRRWNQKKNKLSNKSPLIKKIKNGDFEFSPYFWQIKYCEYEINQKEIKFKCPIRFLEETRLDRIRRKKLIEDFERDEKERMDELVKSFLKEFHFNEETLKKELESFDGTIEEFYIYCNKSYCKKL